MPEKVTREERIISMTVEKARKAKELLRESMEGNRLPDEKDDRMEKVKVKRPKAEKDKTKIENNKGTHSGYGLAGESTIAKEDDEDDLRGICREKISQIQEGIYGLPKSSLEELFDALNDIVQSIL